MKKSLAFIGIVASLVVVSTMLETLATPVSAVSQAGNHENSTWIQQFDKSWNKQQ